MAAEGGRRSLAPPPSLLRMKAIRPHRISAPKLAHFVKMATTSLVLGSGLAACSRHGHDHDARIVAYTRECGIVEARPGMFVRLSKFSTDRLSSHSPWVISICTADPDRGGGCNAKAWFEGPYAPNLRSAPDGRLRIEIAGTAHRVFPDYALTERVDVQFTNTRGVDAVLTEKRFKYLVCSNSPLPSWPKPAE